MVISVFQNLNKHSVIVTVMVELSAKQDYAPTLHLQIGVVVSVVIVRVS
jgi:hypothetical protein